MNKSANEQSGCIGMFLQIFGIGHSSAGSGPLPTPSDTDSLSSQAESGPLPFRLRDDFLSPAEMSFYHVLKSAVGDRYTVCPKVNLGDIFFVPRPDQNQAARNRISSKHVDFLLCDCLTMKPRYGIELDDSSHAARSRQTRDSLVNLVFEAAGLPLLRFPAQRSYVLADIALKLSPISGETATPPPIPVTEDTTEVPTCPKCGIPLVIRSGKHGEFYGCSNYPRCRETSAIPSDIIPG